MVDDVHQKEGRGDRRQSHSSNREFVLDSGRYCLSKRNRNSRSDRAGNESVDDTQNETDETPNQEGGRLKDDGKRQKSS